MLQEIIAQHTINKLTSKRNTPSVEIQPKMSAAGKLVLYLNRSFDVGRIDFEGFNLVAALEDEKLERSFLLSNK